MLFSFYNNVFTLDLVVDHHLHQGTIVKIHRKSVPVVVGVVEVAVGAAVGLTMVLHPVPIMAVITSPSRLLMTGGTTNLPVCTISENLYITHTLF